MPPVRVDPGAPARGAVRKRGSPRTRVKAEINVAPLVDVVLVLLIIFMVVTPLLQRGRAVELPRAQEVAELTSRGAPVVVAIARDGRIWLDEAEVARRDLARALTLKLERTPGVAVVVKGDRELDYRSIREVFSEIAKSRVAGVSLAAEEIEPARGR
jgi:biopolymer transport protein ExbD/biopolymer transport protein TolR